MKYSVRSDVPGTVAKELAEHPPLLRKLLYYRGLDTRKDADIFLNPDWDRDSLDPFEIHNMRKAVDRILDALSREEKIVLYTDFDCDGIPAGVILHDLFKKIGCVSFSNYIPHRHDEGYGVNTTAVEEFAKNGAKLMITADVGITDIEAVARAEDLGMNVIVTDHHLPVVRDGKEILPPAFAVLNSKQSACSYADDMLCGAGVAFKLAQALITEGRQRGLFTDVAIGWEKWLLDMAGLSTVADMVPLKRENRLLAQYGIKVLRKSRRKGIKELLRKMRTQQSSLTEDDIGFLLAPRINAASRMDHPLRAFELLSTEDEAEAIRLATHLEKLNNRRKALVATMVKDARKRLAGRKLHEVIVIGDVNWSPGLLGLLSAKLAEEFSRPAFVWGKGGEDIIKGSCRGDGTYSVVDLMSSAKDSFIQFGGHEMAGGFSVSHEHIHTLEDVLSRVYAKSERTARAREQLVDHVLDIDDVNANTYKLLEKLAPFGQENAKPLFLFRSLAPIEVKMFGKAKEHLELKFRNSNGKKISAIAFFATDGILKGKEMLVGEAIDLVATIERSVFRGFEEIRLRIVDMESV